jgi:hypothetical protein
VRAPAPLRVADVLRACWKRYNREHRLPPHVAKAVRSILRCRTSVLGGHIHACDHCGSELPVYNGCQTRHCPSCQGGARRKWLEDRREELLPVEYFHVVFTLPHQLNALIDANRKRLLSEFFSVTGWVLQRFAHDPQWRLEGELGYLALLHTWNQRLAEHFHIHCLVPGGVWREADGVWKPCRRKWLFEKDALADAFRNRFIKRLRALRRQKKLAYSGGAALADEAAWEALLGALKIKKWIVYPKATPGKPVKALEYLARYTHKVAISDSRIKSIENGHVTYTWRDRADNNTEKLDTIPLEEFTTRFCYHILPERFHKIRYGGWLSAARRKKTLAAIREVLGATTPEAPPETPPEENAPPAAGFDRTLCPNCGKGHLQKTDIRILPCKARPPP